MWTTATSGGNYNILFSVSREQRKKCTLAKMRICVWYFHYSSKQEDHNVVVRMNETEFISSNFNTKNEHISYLNNGIAA